MARLQPTIFCFCETSHVFLPFPVVLSSSGEMMMLPLKGCLTLITTSRDT
jgi:hypothetical protein